MKSVSFRSALRLTDRKATRREPPCDGDTDEAVLLERAAQRDGAALGELYNRYAAKIYSYVLYHVGNQDLAEDLTASVFCKMLDAVRTSNAWQTSFTGWLYRVAHNAIIDHFRRRDHGQALPVDEQLASSEDSPAATVEHWMRADAIGQALLQLTEDQQMVVVFKFFQGLTNLQIADQMGKTEGAIKSLQYRALGALRRLLEESPEEADE